MESIKIKSAQLAKTQIVKSVESTIKSVTLVMKAILTTPLISVMIAL